MKKIKIKFIGLGLKDEYQAYVIVYDNCHNIIYNDYTYNGNITVKLNSNQSYKLIATSLEDCISTIFYVNYKICEYKFIFNRSIYEKNNDQTITFLLTDYNYNNLPIEKGELNLCPSQ